MEYYSEIKKNKLLIYSATGINLKCIFPKWMKSDSKGYMAYGKGKIIGQKTYQWLPGVQEEWRVDSKGTAEGGNFF